MRRLSGQTALAIARERLSEATSTAQVVAIDGHSGSGKSTFANMLAANCGATIVRADAFYRAVDARERTPQRPSASAPSRHDWERMRKEAILPLRAGRAASFRPYDWRRDELHKGEIRVRPARVVLIEGLYSARPELEDLIDLSILMYADETERQTRVRRRGHASTQEIERWEAAARWYFDHTRPPHTFDLVVDTALAGTNTRDLCSASVESPRQPDIAFTPKA